MLELDKLKSFSRDVSYFTQQQGKDFRKKIRLPLIFRSFVILSLSALGIWILNALYYKPFTIDFFFERMFIEQGLEDPELLSRLRILEPYGIDFHNRKLTDISDKQQTDNYSETVNRHLELLQSYKRSTLTESQLLSRQVLEHYLTNQVFAYSFRKYDYIVNHVSGLQTELPKFMIEIHKIDDLRDAENYLTRLSGFDEKFDDALKGLKIREDSLNVIMPGFLIDHVLQDIDNFLKEDISRNILCRDFMEKVSKCSAIRPKAKKELIMDCKGIIEYEIYPAYRELYSFFEAQKERVPDFPGFHRIGADSATYHFAKSAAFTTLGDDIYTIQITGEDEVDALKYKMRSIMDSLNVSKDKSIGAYMSELAAEPRFLYTEDSLGYIDFMADFNEHLKVAQSILHTLFEEYPTDVLEIRRVSHDVNNQYPTFNYIPPDPETGEEGYIAADLNNLSKLPKYEIPLIVYREAVAKRIQLFYENRQKNIPTFRKVIHFDAFTEGWVLYIEKLLYEKGMYYDPYVRLGKLRQDMLYAAKMVVDIKIYHNSRKWTRDYAVNYLYEHTGLEKTRLTKLVDRMYVLPGEAGQHTMAFKKFEETRMVASIMLDSLFFEKKYHKEILKNGQMPLPVLNQHINKYVQEVQAEQGVLEF